MNKIAGFLAILLTVVAPAMSHAASSDWEDLGGGKARLVAELDPATGTISGVVEFALDEGWKTYWREPGGSGIPPEFDFTGSRLFIPGEVKFPVPRHITLENSEFAGYRGRVLFPFQGRAVSLDQTGRIHLAMIAGVCAEVCIPATAEFEIPFAKLMGSDSDAAMVIADALLTLPGSPHEGLRVTSLVRDGKAVLIATAEVAPDAPAAELFAEGPEGWNLRSAKLVSRDGNTASFHIDLSELDRNLTIGGTTLRLTLGDGKSGVEQEMKIGN